MNIASVSKEELTKLVFIDELTNLYNRRFFNRYLNEDTDWKSPASRPLSLLMIDIDYFKRINDTYGHLEGDNVLTQLGAVLKEAIGTRGLVIRYAGDEFSLVLPSVDKNQSFKVSCELLELVGKTPFKRRDERQSPLNIQISIGIASFPDDAGSSLELIEQADKALYLSKRQGRNRVSIVGTFSEDDVLEKTIFQNFPCPHFIGRQDFYQEIIQALSDYKMAHLFILLEGPVGSGKSRLLKELSSFPDALTFYSCCDEIEINIPYKPLITFLRELSKSNNPALRAVIDELPAGTIKELRKLVPLGAVSSTIETAAVVPSGEEGDRKLLFDALTEVLGRLSLKTPILFMIDEFQNIDPATLLVLSALTDRTEGHCVFLGAIRDEYLVSGATVNDALNHFLSALEEKESASNIYRRISLSVFNAQQTTEMISRILPHQSFSPAFDNKIYQTTKGNPLFIEELLKHLLLTNYIRYKNKQWVLDLSIVPSLTGLPWEPPSCEGRDSSLVGAENIWTKDLDEIIRENIDLLETETQTIIKQATVVGREVPVDILKDVAKQNEGETIDALDKAKQLNIIRSTVPSNDDHFTFTSKRFQEVIYDRIDEKEKEMLHQAVGEVTEKLYQSKPGGTDAVAPALAYHFNLAGNTEKAQAYSQQMGQNNAMLFRKDEIPGYYTSSTGIVLSRIKEAINPLSSSKMSLVKDLLRNLISSNKNIRFYPDSSQLTVNTLFALIKVMNSIFEEAEIFTLSESKNLLHINTVVLDTKTYGSVVDEFLSLMKEHYIKGVTFRKGCSERETEKFLINLDKSPDKPFAQQGYWNQYLDEKGITNIGITQRAFIAKKDKAVATALTPTAEKIELDSVLIQALKDFIRFFCAAIENIKLYPPGSSLSLEAMRYVNKSIEEVFKHLPPPGILNISVSEDILLINGNPVHQRLLGQGAVLMVNLIHTYQLKSIAFTSEVSKQEMESFVEMLGRIPVDEARNKSATDWETFSTEKGINNIKIGATFYVTAEKVGRGRPGGYRGGAGEPSATAGEQAPGQQF
ncbi:MAG: diguanylate cyclase, partial [Planctomycetota bacterium]|nr:diguanylate cyclase [Planctomycetota bacterium]MDI6787345.1 diguanylate cyclase [Planctomycetota bacterium]